MNIQIFNSDNDDDDDEEDHYYNDDYEDDPIDDEDYGLLAKALTIKFKLEQESTIDIYQEIIHQI